MKPDKLQCEATELISRYQKNDIMASHLEEVLGQTFNPQILIIYLHLAVRIFGILVPPAFMSDDFHEIPRYLKLNTEQDTV